MASRFGEMLLNRRRELGLSIQQVANVIKIRPQIIEFFETGNFASMPPRGYAQGMIASYARYLGLNPREVVGAYFDELYVYERGGSAAGSQFTEDAGTPVPRSVSTSGRYLMVDPPPAPSSRFGQRPPQAGYVSDSTSGHVPLRVADSDRRAANLPPVGVNERSGVRTGCLARPLYGEEGATGPDRTGTGRPLDRTVRMNRPAPGPSRGRGAGSRGQVPPRGRTGSGGGGRRPPYGSRGRGTGRGGAGRHQQTGPLNDPRIMIAGLAVILVLLVLVVFLLVRSCTSAQPASEPATTAAVTSLASPETAGAADSPASADTADEPADADDPDAATDTDASDEPATDTAGEPQTVAQTEVEVSLPEGDTAWIEISVDGTVVYGAQTAGPFERSFTPSQSIEVTTTHPNDVQVTRNGEKVSWDAKTSGVGKVTITVPQPDTSAATGDAADGESGEGATDDSVSAAA